MSLEVQMNAVKTHLSIKAVGQYSLADLISLLDRSSEELTKYSYLKGLLDVTGVGGDVPALDMVALGEHCSRVMKPGSRIAIVSQKGSIHKVFENVARNRKIVLAVVASQEAALEWLNGLVILPHRAADSRRRCG